jgi:hypothetical protein
MGEYLVRQAVKRVGRSAYDIFGSVQNTLLAQILIAILLGVSGLSGGRYEESHQSERVVFDG